MQRQLQSKSLQSPQSRGSKTTFFDCSWCKQFSFFRNSEHSGCLFFLLGHRRSNILQWRANVHSPNFQRSIEVGRGLLILFVLLDWRIGNWRFLIVFGIELTDAIPHNVDYLFVFRRLFIIFFYDSAEAIRELNKELGTAALLFRHLHKLCHIYWRTEKLSLITLFEFRTNLVFATEELLPFLHQGRHFLVVHGQNNLYECRQMLVYDQTQSEQQYLFLTPRTIQLICVNNRVANLTLEIAYDFQMKLAVGIAINGQLPKRTASISLYEFSLEHLQRPHQDSLFSEMLRTFQLSTQIVFLDAANSLSKFLLTLALSKSSCCRRSISSFNTDISSYCCLISSLQIPPLSDSGQTFDNQYFLLAINLPKSRKINQLYFPIFPQFIIQIRKNKLIQQIKQIIIFQLLVKLIDSLDYYLKMGNDSSLQANDSFLKQDWEPVERLAQFQIWQNKKDPSFRIEQYEISTQTDTQLSHQKRMFQLRRRSPLLIAAYYFQSQSKQQFCSTNSRHFLYLQRIPIRLEDIQHVPYPDYLHLYGNCLLGFAQLARSVGYFPVDEGMIGFNERGVAKVWLSEDFARSKPFSGRVTEENMIRSLIQCIQRNVDSDQLPRSVPSIRNYLYRNVDTLNFDAAIWEFNQFVNKFNSGRIPSKLDCIQKAGGIYVIANRQQYKYGQYQVRIEQQHQPYEQQNNSIQYQQQFSQNNSFPVNNYQPQSPQIPMNNFQESNQFNSARVDRVKNNNWSVEKENTSNKPLLIDNRINQEQIMLQNHKITTSPRNVQNLERQLFNQQQQLQYQQNPKYPAQLTINPSLSQNNHQKNMSNQINFQSNQRIKFGVPVDSQVVYPTNALQGPQSYQVPINPNANHVILSPRSSQISQNPQHFHFMSGLPMRKSQSIPLIALPSQNNIQMISQPVNQALGLPRQQYVVQPPQYYSQTPIGMINPHSQIALQPSFEAKVSVPLPQPQAIQVPPIIVSSSVAQQTVYTPRSSNIIKYTVEVIPGKVIPQKNSTILRKSSIKNSTIENNPNLMKENGALLDNCSPKIATSIKQLQRQSTKMIQPSPIPQRSQHLQHQQGGDFIRSKQTIQKQVIERKNQFTNSDKLKTSETVILVNPSDEQENRHPIQKIHNLSQRVAVTTKSYEVSQSPINPQKPDIINQQVCNDNQEEASRQQLMSVWTAAGNHKSPINQIESFNPAKQYYDDEAEYHEQAQFYQKEQSPKKFENQPVSLIKTQEYQQGYNRYDNYQQEQIRQTANFNQQSYNQNNYDEKQIRETGYFKDYQKQLGAKPYVNGESYVNSSPSLNHYGYYQYNDYNSHGLTNKTDNYRDYKYDVENDFRKNQKYQPVQGILTSSQENQYDYNSESAFEKPKIVASKINQLSLKQPIEYNTSTSSYSQYLRNLTGQIYTNDEMDYVHSVASKNPNYSELTSFQYYRPGLSSTQNYRSGEGEYDWQK